MKGIQGVINPPQKLAEGEKMPQPPDIPTKKPSKDASAVQELEAKLKTIQTPDVPKKAAKDSNAKDVGARVKDSVVSRVGGPSQKTSKNEVSKKLISDRN